MSVIEDQNTPTTPRAICGVKASNLPLNKPPLLFKSVLPK